MENSRDIIPFAKELLRQKPSWSVLKIYALGSTLALLGMVGGMVEMILLPFLHHDATEEERAQFFIEQKRERRLSLPAPASLRFGVEDVMGAAWSEVKAKHLERVVQRSSANRLHAS